MTTALSTGEWVAIAAAGWPGLAFLGGWLVGRELRKRRGDEFVDGEDDGNRDSRK